MLPSISHDRQQETIEERARWFQTLTMQERTYLFCEITDLILAIYPNIAGQKVIQPIPGRILVVSKK